MTCRKCGTDIAANALICYRCGTATAEPRVQPPTTGSVFDRPRRRWPIVPIAIAAIVIAIILWFLFGTPLGVTSGPPVTWNHEETEVTKTLQVSEDIRADVGLFAAHGPEMGIVLGSHGAWF
jgi:hypothetical protein